MARVRDYKEIDRFMHEAEEALLEAARVAYRDNAESENNSRIAAVWVEMAKVEAGKPTH